MKIKSGLTAALLALGLSSAFASAPVATFSYDGPGTFGGSFTSVGIDITSIWNNGVDFSGSLLLAGLGAIGFMSRRRPIKG
jgi:hypothetical protein